MPEIVSRQQGEQTIALKLFIAENVAYFEGHFPGTPILAGVVQLDWAVELAAEEFDLPSKLVKEVQVLKFQNVIRPNSTVMLELSLSQTNKFSFKYLSEHGVHASGRVLLEE